jgi:hypothetical protein
MSNRDKKNKRTRMIYDLIMQEINQEKVKCVVCGKHPSELMEYIEAAKEYEPPISPVEYIVREEGTFSWPEEIFCCTVCYVNVGMPLGRAQWSWSKKCVEVKP